MIYIHIFVSGQVQGVSFRWYVTGQARRLNLSGWVRNRINGQVEMVIVGQKKEAKKMIDLFWQGPPLAKVENITKACEREIDEDPFGGKFEKKPTV